MTDMTSDRLTDEYPITPEQAAAAIRTIAARNLDSDQTAELLDMLGLTR